MMIGKINLDNITKPNNIACLLNGSIYDYEYWKSDFANKHVFKSDNTRTDLLCNIYKTFGNGFAEKFRGDFTIAIVDSEKQKVLLARDQAGHKQLYYTVDDGKFSFSFSMEDILKERKKERKINLKALNFYLDFRFIPYPNTLFEGIKVVPPGHTVIYEKGNIQVKPYWERKYQTSERKSEDYYAKRLYELMEDAVGVRLEGNGPIGAFLSGGLDSSTLVGLMAKINKRPVKTFTAGFSESDFNEIPDAKTVSDYFGVEHHSILIKPEDVIKFLPNLIRFSGQPFYDSTAIATYYAAKLAKEHVDTVLDAHGPDQQLASFDDYIIPIKYRLRNILTFDLAERIILNKTLFRNGLKEKLFNFPTTMADDVSNFIYTELKKVKSRSLLEKLLYWDCQHSVPDYLMVKLESMVGPHNLEVRNPFLDVRVMDFILTIPDDLKLRMVYNPIKKYIMKQKPVTRYIMKKAMGSLLPEDTLRKKKQHFSVPLKHWMKNQLKDYTCDILLSQKALSRDFWNGQAIKDIARDFYSGKKPDIHYGIVWTLLLIELWNRGFIDTPIYKEQEVYAS